MIAWLNNRSVGTKLITNIALIIAGFVIVAGAALSVSHSTMLEERKGKLKAIVEVVGSYAGSLQADVKAGTLTKDQAIARFSEHLNKFRYDGNNYFTLMTDKGVYVVQPNSATAIGKDSSDAKDAYGFPFVKVAWRSRERRAEGFTLSTSHASAAPRRSSR